MPPQQQKGVSAKDVQGMRQWYIQTVGAQVTLLLLCDACCHYCAAKELLRPKPVHASNQHVACLYRPVQAAVPNKGCWSSATPLMTHIRHRMLCCCYQAAIHFGSYHGQTGSLAAFDSLSVTRLTDCAIELAVAAATSSASLPDCFGNSTSYSR